LKARNVIVNKFACFFMPRLIVALIVILAMGPVNSTQAVRNNNSDRVHFKFQEINALSGVTMRHFGDFDGDGFEEIVSSSGWGGIIFNYDQVNPNISCHLMGADSVNKLSTLDLIVDPAPEVVLSLYKDNEAWLNIYGISQNFGGLQCSLIVSTKPLTGIDRNQDGFWDGIMVLADVLDVDDDGDKDIIGGVRTGYDRTPRGLVAFDGQSGEIIWEYPIGSAPSTMAITDIDADGFEDILLATWAPGNMSDVNGICDTICHLICLDRHGREIWKVRTGLAFYSTTLKVDDLNNDGQYEIYNRYSSGRSSNQTTYYELQIRSIADGSLIKYFRLPQSFGEPVSVDLNRDGRKELITPNQDGYMYYTDSDLKLLGKYQIGAGLHMNWVAQTVDIDLDGTTEIIICDLEGILILNDKFEIVGKLDCDFMINKENVHFFRHPIHGNVLSVVKGSKKEYSIASIYKINLSELQDSGAGISLSFSQLLIIFGSGALISLLILWVGQKLIRRKQQIKNQTAEENRYALLQTLSAFGHGKTATANMDRLSLLFINLPEADTVPVEYLAKLDDSVQTFFDFTLPSLEDIILKIQLAGVGRVQLNTIENNLAKLKNSLNNFRNFGIESIKREHFSKELPRLNSAIEASIKLVVKEISYSYSCGIVNVINEVLAALHAALIENNICFGNLAIKGNPAVRGFMARSELVEIVEELIRNALRAMKDSLQKNLNISIEVGEHKVFIDVIDSGVGIPENTIDQIFNREFTTREEGGFGLYHSKSILDKYGAKIKVAKSIIGQGTTIRLELKKVV